MCRQYIYALYLSSVLALVTAQNAINVVTTANVDAEIDRSLAITCEFSQPLQTSSGHNSAKWLKVDPATSNTQELVSVIFKSVAVPIADDFSLTVAAPVEYDGSLLPSGGRVTFTLRIKEVRCSQDVIQQLYRCDVNIEGAAGSSDTTVSVSAPPLIPVIETEQGFNNSLIMVDVGNQVTLNCNTNLGVPSGKLLWYYIPDPGNPDAGVSENLSEEMTTEANSGDCRLIGRSTLIYTVKPTDHYATIKCIVYLPPVHPDTVLTYDSVKLGINALITTTQDPNPGQVCDNPPCGAATSIHISAFLLVSITVMSLYSMVDR